MSREHRDSLTTTVLHQCLLTNKKSPLPSDFPVTVGSLSRRTGSPKPFRSRSDWRSCCLSQVSVREIRQAFLYSGPKLTFACKTSILFRSDCALARMTVGRGILRWPCFFSLWSIPPRLPCFLTAPGLDPRVSPESACRRMSVGNTAKLSRAPVPVSQSRRRNSQPY